LGRCGGGDSGVDSPLESEEEHSSTLGSYQVAGGATTNGGTRAKFSGLVVVGAQDFGCDFSDDIFGETLF